MKKFLVILLAAIFILPQPLSYAAEKPCSKSSVGKTKAGSVCTKVGSVYRWKSLPKPTPTPTPSPTPTPTPLPTPIPTPIKVPTQEELAAKSYLDKAKKSYDEWQLRKPKNNESNLTVKFFYTNNLPTAFLEIFKSEAESSAKYFSQFIDTKQVFNIYLLTELDEGYMDQIGLWDGHPENRPTQFTSWRWGTRLNSCEGSAAWFTNSKGETFPSLQGGIAISSNAKLQNFYLPCLRTVTHEMFHAVQDYWLTNKKGNMSYSSSNLEYEIVEMPIFREGSAEYVSGMVATSSFENYLASLKARYKEQARVLLAYKDLNTVSSITLYLKKIEFKNAAASAHDDSYLLGNLFFEYLVGEYGFEKLSELLKSHNRDIAFRDVFLKVYGISIDQAYSDSSTQILNGLTFLES